MSANLTGQGPGLAQMPDFPEELRLRVWVAEDPMTCVARGAGMIVEDLDRYDLYLADVERNGYRSR